ncbi:carboxypeptidase regulatory-like domain-containing protein [Myxococcus eversor]|uniref:carboxypeptidase regulatory-like domain-containing protein n=1 Tax=Myxococcus eversor TaxID=2709661 RepID=UPI001F07268B|nr:carboxypeptidase regulatory-like domain-containing protein [Myxococcus eversor]
MSTSRAGKPALTHQREEIGTSPPFQNRPRAQVRCPAVGPGLARPSAFGGPHGAHEALELLLIQVAVSVTLPDGRAGKVVAESVAGKTTQADVVVEAGGVISGRLVDATGAPLPDAFVDVDGLTSPPTGADGRFRVEDVAPGPHKLIAWSQKTERAEKTLELAAGKTKDVGDWNLGPPRVEPGRLGVFFSMDGDEVLVRGVTGGLHGDAIRAGDVVKSIDGATVLTAGEARERELGAPGSPATLLIRRDTRTYPITLTRAP